MTILSAHRFSLGFRRYDGLAGQRDMQALEDINFDIEPGEVLAMVGASGAGKSLLAHAIFGILPSNALTSGRLMLGGEELDARNRRKLCGRRMALVPQSISHLDPMVRCGQQLAWAAARGGGRAGAVALRETFARFGLDDRVARAFPHQLSGGLARRVLLAIATVGDPDLIVADEPTSNLDLANSTVVLRHLRGFADAGQGVLLITHSLAEALPFADRVALMQDGTIVGIEDAAAFAGDGHQLVSPYARALWLALPQNAFFDVEHRHA